MNHQITISKRTALSAALCLALGTGTAQAATWSGTFTMYSSSGGVVGTPDTKVTGSISGSGTFTIASNVTFFGLTWTAHGGTTFGAGTYTFNTNEGGTYTNVVVGANQVGAHILFDWGTTKNIDVVMVWDKSTDASGNTTYTSTDGVGTSKNATAPAPNGNLQDGIRGYAMVDGAFPGFNANFDMTTFSAFSVQLSASQGGVSPILVTTGDGNVTITTSKSTESGYTFSWGGDLTGVDVVTDGGTAVNGTTYEFNPATLTAGTSYTISVTVTNSDSKAVAASTTITMAPATALTTADTDGDGIADNDSSEGYKDNDGDGIPNYLDPTNDSASLVAVNTTDTSLGSMSASTGTITLGATALSNSITNMLNGTAASGIAVTTSDIGTTDDAAKASCVGGCFDFKVTGLSSGGSTKVVIPLSTPLGDFPVYRKFAGSKWSGFVIDDNNTISSAAALSTNPVTCPTAGSSSYSNVGLTPGDQCIQLTMEDGGPNDADGTADGVITDPGGVATTGETIMVADVPNGCSMSTTPVNPAERADWWLVAGFLGALAWLRGMRRKGHAA